MPDAFPADVGVAIVAHNNREQLVAGLPALTTAGCPQEDILVVDVASTDGTAAWLREHYPHVRQARLETNNGPDPGRNLGVREVTKPFVFLMDADVRVQPDTIQRLRAVMAADPTIKVGSPVVVHADAPETIQYAGGSLHFICEAINPWLDRPLAQRGTGLMDVNVAPTCGLLLDREAAIDVGLFDERYFIGKEDGDFTHRIRLAGYRIAEPGDALLLHRSRPRGTWLFYYQIRNRWHFMLKNYEWLTLLLILPCLAVYEPMQLVVLHAKGHGRTYWRAVAGLLAMLPALPADRALTRRIRRLRDRDLLVTGRLIVRDDLVAMPLVRWGKGLFEGLLNRYWAILTRTVLAA